MCAQKNGGYLKKLTFKFAKTVFFKGLLLLKVFKDCLNVFSLLLDLDWTHSYVQFGIELGSGSRCVRVIIFAYLTLH